ncbi:hypothetical protein [Ramlibacter albus]|uniref:Uncharacterized protein n=1 Tax=Ramlibacter albus TaxID=2079448 RepID=A0A923M9W2_9BURK|nr:hypothetical protein [Ramlibacter albus]MBC5765568.1 hypothetical protein [Ramlibacter albus]
MGPLDFIFHLLGFVLPAFGVAVLVALLARWLLRGEMRRSPWWAPVLVNFFAGVATLAGGLVVFGRDGKMATYAALAVVVATVQWLYGRGWRR